MGRVTEVGPEVKKLITKSSMDRVKASRAADTIPGTSRGRVTCRRVYQELAYRSRAASSTVRPMVARRLATTRATKEIWKVTWATIMVPRPRLKALKAARAV